jgi:hypothetical protein
LEVVEYVVGGRRGLIVVLEEKVVALLILLPASTSPLLHGNTHGFQVRLDHYPDKELVESRTKPVFTSNGGGRGATHCGRNGPYVEGCYPSYVEVVRTVKRIPTTTKGKEVQTHVLLGTVQSASDFGYTD